MTTIKLCCIALTLLSCKEKALNLWGRVQKPSYSEDKVSFVASEGEIDAKNCLPHGKVRKFSGSQILDQYKAGVKPALGRGRPSIFIHYLPQIQGRAWLPKEEKEGTLRKTNPEAHGLKQDQEEKEQLYLS